MKGLHDFSDYCRTEQKCYIKHRLQQNITELILKLLIALGPGEEHVHPDPHSFGRGSHQIILPVLGLHTECHSLSHGLAGLMIHIHLGDGVEVNAAFDFGLKMIIFNYYCSDVD